MTTQLANNYTLAFVIGALSSFPSIMPTVLALQKKPTIELYRTAKIENMIWTLPLFYGVLHVILFYLINNFFPKQFQNYLTLGIIIGLIYPTLGTISGHAKATYEDKSTLNLYIKAQILYIFTYAVVFNYIGRNICK